MMEELGKLFYVFILGFAVIAIGLLASLFEIVLLGGLLASVSGFIMLIRLVAQWK